MHSRRIAFRFLLAPTQPAVASLQEKRVKKTNEEELIFPHHPPPPDKNRLIMLLFLKKKTSIGSLQSAPSITEMLNGM